MGSQLWRKCAGGGVVVMLRISDAGTQNTKGDQQSGQKGKSRGPKPPAEVSAARAHPSTLVGRPGGVGVRAPPRSMGLTAPPGGARACTFRLPPLDQSIDLGYLASDHSRPGLRCVLLG